MTYKYHKCEDHKIPSGRKCWDCFCCKDTTDLKEIKYYADKMNEAIRKALQNKEI